MPINSRVDGHTIQYYITTMKQTAAKHSKMSHNVEKKEASVVEQGYYFVCITFPQLAKPTYGVSFQAMITLGGGVMM